MSNSFFCEESEQKKKQPGKEASFDMKVVVCVQEKFVGGGEGG